MNAGIVPSLVHQPIRAAEDRQVFLVEQSIEVGKAGDRVAGHGADGIDIHDKIRRMTLEVPCQILPGVWCGPVAGIESGILAFRGSEGVAGERERGKYREAGRSPLSR